MVSSRTQQGRAARREKWNAMASYVFNYTKKNAPKDMTLREGASQLLRVGMWGIGDRTPNRGSLAEGDRVLIFVGAPEREFIGDAVLASPVHEWSASEATRYPGEWHAGVLLRDVSVWEHPTPIQTVWSQTSAAKNNPMARFFAGVVRITGPDFEIISTSRKVPTASIGVPGSDRPHQTNGPVVEPHAHDQDAVDRLYAHARHASAVVQDGKSAALSEDATRALLINRLLDAVGFTDIGDVEYGVKIASGDTADYVLLREGSRVAVVEAKRLGAELGSKQAAQLVKYTSVLGLRWGVLTDGRFVKVYDCRIPGAPPEDRLLFEVDTTEFVDREDFEVRLYPRLSLLSKDAIGDAAELSQYAAMTAARDLLTSESSRTVSTLRDELKAAKLIALTTSQVAELLDQLLG